MKNINEAKKINARESSHQFDESNEVWNMIHWFLGPVIEDEGSRMVHYNSEYLTVGNCLTCGNVGMNDQEVKSCRCQCLMTQGSAGKTWKHETVHIALSEEDKNMFFAMHPMKFCKWHNAELDEDELCLQSQENAKTPLKSMADMKKEDGIVDSNVIHIRTMTLGFCSSMGVS